MDAPVARIGDQTLMNARLCAFFTIALMIGCVAGGAAAEGIVDAVKTSTSVRTKVIEDFVSEQAAKLKSSDSPKAAVQQSAARDALIAEVSPKSGLKSSDEYINAYTAKVDAAMKPLAGEPSLRTRLNAAIVVARLAEKTKNVVMVRSAAAFMGDKSAAVALWGVKAGGSVLPGCLALPNKNETLLPAIVKAVEDHPLSGAIADEAYQALSLNIIENRAAVTAAMVTAVIPYFQDLLAFRIQRYVDGIPDEPAAERLAPSFLTDALCWSSQSNDQKIRTVQLLSDLLFVAVHQAASGNRIDEKLVPVIRYTASGLSELGKKGQGSSAMSEVVKPLKETTPTSLPKSVVERVNQVYPAIRDIPAYSSVKPPPQVTAHAPATTQAAAQP